MSYKIKLVGLEALRKGMDKSAKRLASNIAGGIREAAFVVEGEAKRALTIGETRAIDTGRLRADTIVRQITPYQATIAPVVKYAIYVHEGTHKMSPRPFMEKAIDESQEKIKKIFGKRLKASLKI